MFSLFRASKELSGPFLFLYGDIVFERGLLEKLLKSPADISIVVDRAYAEGQRPKDARGVPDLVALKDAQEAGYRFVGAEAPHRVARVGRAIPAGEAHGEFVGMALFTAKGARLLTDCYHQAAGEPREGRLPRRPSRSAARPSPTCSRSSSTAAQTCRRSTFTRGGSRSTRSRTTVAPGRSSRSEAMSHGSGKSYAPEFVAALKEAGFDFFAGVPCSLLKGLVSLLDADASARYISATREDSAIGMAFGAWLGGRLPMVPMQNSGSASP